MLYTLGTRETPYVNNAHKSLGPRAANPRRFLLEGMLPSILVLEIKYK